MSINRGWVIQWRNRYGPGKGEGSQRFDYETCLRACQHANKEHPQQIHSPLYRPEPTDKTS